MPGKCRASLQAFSIWFQERLGRISATSLHVAKLRSLAALAVMAVVTA
jgi:hypothetical protein